MPESNSNKGNNQKAQNTGADRSASEKKNNIAKEAYSGYREAKNVKKASDSRRQVDDTLDGAGSESLQKMGVPKGISDKAIKDGGGKLFPGNSPVNKFVKNKSRDALAKGIDKLGGKNSSNKNFGANLLNNMGNRVKPNNQNGNKQADNIKKATEIAKRIPIPQVQAAAKAVDAANKLGITDKLLSKDKNDSNKLNIKGIFGKNKIVMISILAFAFLLFFMVALSSVVSGSSSTGGSMNEGICVVDQDVSDECEETSEEAKAFYARVKEVKKEFDSNGKFFNPVYIAGFYFSLVSNNVDINYDDMTKSRIEDIANAMFKENETSFDEDFFRENLKNNILPDYLPNTNEKNYDIIIDEIFEYVDNFKEVYGEGNSNIMGFSLGEKLVQIAISQLDDSNTSKYHGEKYWKFMGFSSYVYWCASFVSWCANEAGISEDIILHSAAVDSFYDMYVTAGLFHTIDSGYTPKPGDLIIWKRGQNAKGWSHIGIVEKYDAATGKLYTIEGNSSDSVARNIYSDLGGCTGFASPNYPVVEDDDADIQNGATITLPSGLGTYGTREFDLAYTQSEINYSRSQMACCRRITNPYAFPESSSQRIVQNLWISSGGKHDGKGFCKLNKRYLIAVTSTFGTIGDKIDAYLSNGKIIHGIIADAKSMSDDRANKWGHEYGQVVLEFMGENSIGNNPYDALGITGNVTVTKIVNGGSILK